MSERLRRAACPHAAVMVRWLTGGGLRAARPTEAYLAVRRGGALPLPRATARVAPTEALQGVRQNGPSGKSAKRCQWQMKRAGFEEVPRLADTTVTGNRLARRWATAGPYESVTRNAVQGPAGGVEPRPYERLQGVQWAGDRKGRPYGSVTRGAAKRAVGDAGPYGSVTRRCGAGRNPPVTASPCQPALGKGAEGTGDADCHSRCAHRLRNDREFYMECGTAGRCGHRPLRAVRKKSVGRATARVAPTDGFIGQR